MSRLLQTGMDNLASLNITTGAQLEEYICEGKVDGTLDEGDKWHEFVPYCAWPYTFKGWGDDGEAGYDDVVIGDCSITNAGAYSSAYMNKRIIYLTLNLITVLMSIRFLVIFKEKRLSGNKKVTVNEKLCRLNITICIAHTIICFDQDSTNFYPYVFTSLLQGYCGAGMVSLAFLLINSWVTIIEGGKTKKTPPWMNKLTKFSIPFVIFCEVFLAIIEVTIESDCESSYSGNVNAVKGLAFAILCLIWAGICLKYYLKISKQLKAGGGNSGHKQIKTYCITLLFGMSLGFAYKVAFSILRMGTVVRAPPYCGSPGFVSIVNIMFLIIQFSCLFAQNPKRIKKKISPTTTATSSSASSSSE